MLDVEADAGFWMSVDAEEETQSDWISIATITSTVKAKSAKHVMVVSDSCYSGRLTRGLSVSIKAGAKREEELRRLAAKRSRTALVSGGLEPVDDGGGEGHSVFTRAFLTALRESNEVLDGQQLFTAVRRPVIVNADQTPEYSDIRLAGHDGGDFLFVPVSLGAAAIVTDAPAAAVSVGVSVDIQVWREIKDSTDAAVFETFIESFPSSPMVPFARVKLEQLETALVVPPEPDEPTAPKSQTYEPGDVFSDCRGCPEMVVIPLGEFVMGSPEGEEGRDDNEGPQHIVRIERPFALGKYEVTFAEWDACVAGGGCGAYRPSDVNLGRGIRPAISVNWEHAKAYVGWLSRQTGKEYRLPSESEWEYAARAGTTTARYWGEDADGGCGYANVYDRKGGSWMRFDWQHFDCDNGYARTAPVGSFPANSFGVYDMLGNVSEWVEGCWNWSYMGAPDDGSAWQRGVCDWRVRRGGSWLDPPRNLRGAARRHGETEYKGFSIGFRVARTLD